MSIQKLVNVKFTFNTRFVIVNNVVYIVDIVVCIIALLTTKSIEIGIIDIWYFNLTGSRYCSTICCYIINVGNLFFKFQIIHWVYILSWKTPLIVPTWIQTVSLCSSYITAMEFSNYWQISLLRPLISHCLSKCRSTTVVLSSSVNLTKQPWTFFTFFGLL